MSKLVEKFEKAAQPAPRRMGFVSRQEESKTPPLVLVVRLDTSSAGLIKEAIGPADSVIVQLQSLDNTKKLFKELGKIPESVPWGIQWPGVQPEKLGELGESGCDFLVFGIDDTPASVLNEENLGKVLSISPAVEEPILRILEDVPSETVMIEAEPPDRLTVKDLMSYRSILASVSKPVLLRTSLNLEEGELTALQNVGIIGIVVEPRSKEDMKLTAALRKAIDALPPREDTERRRVETLSAQASPGVEQSLLDDDEDD